MKKQKKFKVKKGKQPIYSVIKCIMRMVYKRPYIINLSGEEIIKKAIVLSNHSAKSSPCLLDLYYPVRNYKWGAHEMFEDYKTRTKYMRDIFYIKKCGKKPGFLTSFMAGFLSIFNVGIYKGMKLLPTYPDIRLHKTVKNSVKVLQEDMSVVIFPENADDGYKTVLDDFFPGFVILAASYFNTIGEDLPIYPVYCSAEKRLMVIGKPMYMQEFVKQGLDKFQIAKIYCDAVNKLYFDHVENALPYKGKNKKYYDK